MAKATAVQVAGNEVVGLTSCLKQQGLVCSIKDPERLELPRRLDKFDLKKSKSCVDPFWGKLLLRLKVQALSLAGVKSWPIRQVKH